MFPIRDHNPSDTTPVVTYVLVALNVVVFLLTWPLFENPYALELFFYRWALVPRDAAVEPLTFLTSMFLHGGPMHLAGNMLFLWIFGDNMEDRMGHGGYLLFYLAGGVAAGLAQVLSAPASTVPMVGASGAIAAVMGGYLLLFPRARVDILVILIVIFRIIPVPAWLVLGLWFVMQIASGAATPGVGGGVAYWAHAGGFLAGLALTVPLWITLGGRAFWARTTGQPPHPPRTVTVRSRVPRVPRNRPRGPWD